MSASPTEVDVDEVEDISVLRDYYRELQQRNQHLQSLVAEDRQRLQKIEFDHRESVDQIAILKSQKQAIQQQLEQSAIKNRILEDKDSIDDALDDVSSASDENDNSNNNNNIDNNNNNNNDTKKSKKKNEIEQLKEEIEDLQLALAEERMLGMQLDFTNRQSAQRADALQYQLAEEKLKNMHLQSSHQQLQLGDSNSSGFVHLRDSNNNDKEIINNNNNHNNENNGDNKKKRKNRNKTNDNDDESVASDLSKEFDLKIEEERVPEVSPDEEAKELRHKLLEEQFEKEELKHQHRKSELQLMQYKEELADLRKKHEQNYSHLDPESALNHLNHHNNNMNNNENIQKTTATSLTDQEKQMYEAKIKELSDQLDISKKKTMSLDRQRRDSLNIMSKNFFAKQLQAARDTHSIEENLQLEIEQLKGDLYDLTKSKVNLLQNTNDTIDQLRQHIVELSNRLRKYEKWDTNGTNNKNSNSNTNENENDDNDSGYDVTDL